MSYQVRLTETAKQDFREITFSVAERSVDSEIARQFVSELREQCAQLIDYPQSGAIPKDRILRILDFRYLVFTD